MRLIVGLGNPGTRYERNRHNLGFMAVDGLVRRHSFPPFREKFAGLIAEGTIGDERVLVLKPQTYMNDSGESVGAAARFYKLASEDVIVIHDELDLKPGKVRVKRGGGAAGHNGLRSIDALFANDTWRIRVGIGHPGVKELVHPYVLQNFPAEEMEWVPKVVEAVAEAMPLMVAGRPDAFMTKVDTILNPRPPKPPREGQSNGDEGGEGRQGEQ
jgi:PTH1 family peptidyl-tRNA hydrolase